MLPTIDMPEPDATPIGASVQWFATKFPTQTNREFSNAYQGKFFKEQGFSAGARQATAGKISSLRTNPFSDGVFANPTS
jgi:hypothetical protein